MESATQHTARACIDLGDRYRQIGQLDKALVLFRQAAELTPDSALAGFKMALVLQMTARAKEAEAAYRQCLAGDPGMAAAWNNLGSLLRDRGGFDEALFCFQKAAAADPRLAQAHFNRGYILENGGRFQEAMACYESALEVEPDYDKALSQLVFLRRSVCRWDGIEELEARLDRLNRTALAAGTTVAETPFKSIARTADPAVNAAIAKSWSDAVARSCPALPLRRKRRRDGRITVGYLSDRFRNAATAHQMLGIFGLHDRTDFVIHAYSCGADDGSRYRRKIEGDCDRFIDLTGMDDQTAARAIAADGVDILVDLKGHTEHSRLGIAARRPAPVQATWLGFPGPVGASFFDYFICDRIVVPDADLLCYRESPVRLPHTYYPTDDCQAVAAESFRRADFDLPEAAVVLCSFNQPFKIDPLLFDCWMTIMAAAPQTVLWLQQKNETVTANLRQHARTRGVDPRRLVFADPLPKDRHLARLRLADLCLDTRIYNGHTTTADALWVGVPVVTLMGRHFASRVSASLLNALGLPELITRDLDGYQNLALSLIYSKGARDSMAKRIAVNRSRMPLFDTSRFVRHIEKAYRKMWQRHRAGLPPRVLDIEEDG